MFGGIVETTSRITRLEDSPGGGRVVAIHTPRGWKLRNGESVAVDGVCSTVQAAAGRAFQVVYMPETLRRTTLGGLRVKDTVNLERSLRLNSLIGGHLVQGHVDATAEIHKIRPDGEAMVYEFELPRGYARYVVEKGSIALDGTSLTVVEARGKWFTVSLLAYTLSHTTLGRKGVGDRVNLETDIVGKYIEKLARR